MMTIHTPLSTRVYGHSARRTLVTGGAGFIGSHLCDALLQHGDDVICVDNLLTGSMRNIRALLNHPHFHFIEHDVRNPLRIEGDLDRIFNMACPASPPHYQKDPIGTMKTCVVGTLNVLELARAKAARVLQASTSEVYGDPEVHPQPETYRGHVSPTGPRACYDEGKRAAETLIFDYHRTLGLEVKVARIFNTYGPRMLENDGRAVSNFVVQALHGEPITVYGSGNQTRSLCFVDDLVRGLEILMESPPSVLGPFNLGNPQEMTIEEIAREVLACTNSASQLQFMPLPLDDPKRRKPNIEAAEKLLGWHPRVPLRKGLEATIAYFALQLATVASPAATTRKRSAMLSHLHLTGAIHQ
jgi:UDP-glucuronate decarboxylase